MTATTRRKWKPWNWVTPGKEPLLKALFDKLRRRMLRRLEGEGWVSMRVLSECITDGDALHRLELGSKRVDEDPVADGQGLLYGEMVIRLSADKSFESRMGRCGTEFRLAQAAAAGDGGQPTPAEARPAVADPAEPERTAQQAVTGSAAPPLAGGAAIVLLPVRDLRLHPVARDVPAMRDAEWQPFLADVRDHGVRDPLTVQKGGGVLDGRHRLRAAQETGQETVPARVVDLPEDEQAALVYRAALLRRHLTDDQRAVLAARWNEAETRAARSQRARKAGQAGGCGRKKAANSSEDTPSSGLSTREDVKEAPAPRARRQAAAQHGVPERKVRAAIELGKQSPELAGKVLAGKMTLLQARRALRSADSPKEGPGDPQGKVQRPTCGPGAAHGDGVETAADVKPQEPPTEPGEAEVEPPTEVRGVGHAPWAQWLRSGFRGVDPAVLAAELIRRLGVDRAARLRDSLVEALAART
jgi:ParB-like chromosome segregation protein Spo0J